MRTARELPEYLTKNLDKLEAAVQPRKVEAKKADPDRILFAQINTEEFVDHGAGVYEDQKGYIWEKQGDWIVLKDTEEDRIVRESMK